MPSQMLSCSACQQEFEFSEEEQAFYEAKGFNMPRKCKPCREAARAQRQGGGGYGGGGGGGYGGGGGGGGGYDRAPRQLYDAQCVACGVATQVPFRPSGVKPVYCRECFQAGRR
jgi:CxxC-x17-CxxC domain-containing protein